ncbi:MAG: phospholipase D-like domain-containing protein, partial [Acidobacteria bacterium]|nr:phospholipase D-like domain-containing protein [Acidobacteriota bacterium]
LSPASGAGDYPAQLHALRHLIEDGVEVRSLQRLHAKVLLVDDSRATVGSQNFTRYARSSKETTALPDRDLAGSVFVETLIEWREQALPVDAGLIQMLLDGLTLESKAVKVATAALLNAFDTTYDEWLQSRRARELADAVEKAQQAAERRQADEQARAVWFGELIRKSPVRLAGTYVLAQRKSIPSGWLDSYESLVVGKTTVQELDYLFMYPILLSETGRMGYGRIGHARITYVFGGLNRFTVLQIGQFRAQLTVVFPKSDLARSNVELQFALVGSPKIQCIISAIFDGENLTPVRVDLSGALHPSHPFIDAVRTYCSPEGGQKALAEEMFRQFRYKRLDRERHSAGDFFEGHWYRFDLIEFAGYPVFLAQKLY